MLVPDPAPAYGPSWRRLPAGIWALGFVSLLMDVSSEMIHVRLPVHLVVGLGTTALTVAIIEGITETTVTTTKDISGAISDRMGKGICGAPRDALVADIAPPDLRGAAGGLRQSLDTVGAFLGPLLAVGLIWAFANDFASVFWIAVIPAFMAFGLILFAVKDLARPAHLRRVRNPLARRGLALPGPAYWWVVGVAAAFKRARFSEAFLILRAERLGLSLMLVPLVLVVPSIAYVLSAFPVGVVLWGLHMGLTRGLPATRVALLGANDGIVSIASLIVGVATAAAAVSEVLIAGVAGLVAGAMSMAAGEYVSVSSQSDIEQVNLARQPEFECADLALTAGIGAVFGTVVG